MKLFQFFSSSFTWNLFHYVWVRDVEIFFAFICLWSTKQKNLYLKVTKWRRWKNSCCQWLTRHQNFGSSVQIKLNFFQLEFHSLKWLIFAIIVHQQLQLASSLFWSSHRYVFAFNIFVEVSFLFKPFETTINPITVLFAFLHLLHLYENCVIWSLCENLFIALLLGYFFLNFLCLVWVSALIIHVHSALSWI